MAKSLKLKAKATVLKRKKLERQQPLSFKLFTLSF
jgi:hypothetical protein